MFNKLKWKLQRLVRGHSDLDLWSLDHRLSEIIIPKLKAFRNQNLSGYPSQLRCQGEWIMVLDEMIWALEHSLDDELDQPEMPASKTEFITREDGSTQLKIHYEDEELREQWVQEYKNREERIQDGFELFGKYYRNLWD